jgi:hypothetical protein
MSRVLATCQLQAIDLLEAGELRPLPFLQAAVFDFGLTVIHDDS